MDDLISRQTAIDEISRWIGYLDDDMIGRIQLGLKRLPSAEPFVIKMDRFVKADERERLEKELYRKMTQQNLILLEPGMELVYPKRKGKWIAVHDPVFADTYYCSECKEEPLATDTEWVLSNFCPNCGADMRGEDDGNVSL